MHLTSSIKVLAKHGWKLQQLNVSTACRCISVMRSPAINLEPRKRFSNLGVMSSADDGHHENALQEASSPTNVYVPQHRPSKLDRITLIATGTMKAHEIGTEVSFNAVSKAYSRRQIAFNIAVMVVGLLVYLYAMQEAKKAVKTESIYDTKKK